MIRLLRYILLSGIVLLATLKVSGQTALPDNVCIGQTRHYNVVPHPGSTFTWWIDGMIQTGFVSNELTHTWDTEGIYQISVQELSADGCLGIVQTGTVNVYSVRIPVFDPQGPHCIGATAQPLPNISLNGITGTWNPAVINTSVVGTSTYTFTPASGQCASPATLDVQVTVSITPTFAAIGPLCQGSAPPSLPLTSSNGITGTWNPSAISTTNIGTTAYTFTLAAGQCASPATLDVEVTASITPTIAAIGPLCQGSAPPSLPLTSSNELT